MNYTAEHFPQDIMATVGLQWKSDSQPWLKMIHLAWRGYNNQAGGYEVERNQGR